MRFPGVCDLPPHRNKGFYFLFCTKAGFSTFYIGLLFTPTASTGWNFFLSNCLRVQKIRFHDPLELNHTCCYLVWCLALLGRFNINTTWLIYPIMMPTVRLNDNYLNPNKHCLDVYKQDAELMVPEFNIYQYWCRVE